MTPYERCQSLILLLNGRFERFDRTRTIQWNFNGIFWTGIIVATGFLYPHKDELQFSWCSLLLFGLLLTGIHSLVIYMIQSSLDYDKAKIIEYTRKAEQELKLNNLTDDKILVEAKEAELGRKGKSRKWLIIQIVITAVLVFVSSWLLI